MVFATVLFSEPSSDIFGGVRLDLLTETGYWHEAYSVRLFPSHLKNLSVAVGDKLDVDFHDGYSDRRFRKVKKVRKASFQSCSVCQRFIIDSCSTDHDASKLRIKGLVSPDNLIVV